MPPKVFISYSHDSKDHAARVLALSDALCRDGVDAMLDQYEPVPKEGRPRWIERNLDEANFVIMVCTPMYLQSFTRPVETEDHSGVYWQGDFITRRLNRKSGQADKYLPILLDGANVNNIPPLVQEHTPFQITEFELENGPYQALYRHLTGQPATSKPELGTLKILQSTLRYLENKQDREFEEHYLAALAKKLDRVELFIEKQNLPEESRNQELTVAYVTLELNRGRDAETTVGSIPADALFNVLPGGPRRVLVVGPAGCGKTTLLRWIGLEAARRRTSKFELDGDADPKRFKELMSTETDPWREKIPFLIRLRDWKEGTFPTPKHYHVWGIVTHDAPDGWAERVLKAGRGILLLDGLDELAPPRRLEALDWIRDLTENLSDQNIFVVSSRPQAVKADALSAALFSEFGVRDLSPDGKVEFVKRWHKAVQKRLGGGPDITADLQEKQERLLKELKTNRSVSLLASNPLLGALLCALNRVYQQSLPENLRDLCESACQMLLWDRDQLQSIAKRDFIPAYDALLHLTRLLIVQSLAYDLVKGGESQPVLSRPAAANIIARTLHGSVEQNAAHLIEAEEVIHGLIDRSGLLRECGEDEVEFVHNSLRDYLASLEFVQSKDYGYLVRQMDAGDVERWEPVILFAAATDRDREFGKNLIKKFLTFGKLGRERIRRRELLALKITGHIPFPLGDDLDARISEIRDKLLPINTVEKAQAMVEAGQIACEYLKWQDGREEEIAAICVLGLGRMDSEVARGQLAIYLERDHRPAVLDALLQVLPIEEIAAVVNVLQIPSVLTWCFAQPYERDNQKPFARYICDLTPLSGLTKLEQLYLSNTSVSDVSSLSGLSQLQWLNLSNTSVSDVSSLSGLTKLEQLYLSNTSVSDVSSLSGLSQLQWLNLSNTSVSDVSSLSGLTKLEQLYLSNTSVSDVSSLSGLTKLEQLYLSNTSVSDVSSLSGLTKLEQLYLSNTSVSDVSSLSGLTKLEQLNLSNTSVSDVSSLSGVPQLQSLSLNNTSVSDVSSLSGLSQLRELSLNNTSVSDVSSLSGLSQLRELSLNNTSVSDVSSLSGLSQLRELSLNNTSVSDVSSLSGLSQLRELSLNNTSVSDVSSLSGLSQLQWLYLNNTSVSDVSSLSGLSQLQWLYLNNTSVSDVSSLSGLSQLRELSLNNTSVSDVSSLSGLSQLRELSLNNTSVSDVSSLSGLTELRIIGVRGKVRAGK